MSGQAPADSAFAALVVELERCPYHAFLRPEPVSAEAGLVSVRLPYRPEFRLAWDSDVVHGGILAALIDITGHAAIASRVGHVSPTVDLRVDFLKPARGEALVAIGRVLRAGRSLARVDVEVRDPAGSVVALGRGTFSTLTG
jgi:uncharacterized protein (TIGR00369 family)